MNEEKILKYYDAMIRIIGKRSDAGYVLYEMLVNAFIIGHEMGDSTMCTEEFYESLFLWQIAGFNSALDKKKQIDLTPFNIIDQEYYSSLIAGVRGDILKYRRLGFLS